MTLVDSQPSFAANCRSFQVVSDRSAHIGDGLGRSLSISPTEAFAAVETMGAVLVDIRTIEERRLGYPTGSLHIAWQVGAALLKNPRFFRELTSKTPVRAPVLLICRSGRRSLAAARAARAAGLAEVYDVAEGCDGVEGAPAPSGWKAYGLPWTTG